MDRYQVLIVGAGFSGAEAAYRLASKACGWASSPRAWS
jgi:flavin-dependent dehydrogenase